MLKQLKVREKEASSQSRYCHPYNPRLLILRNHMYVFTGSGRQVCQSTHWQSEAIVDSAFSFHRVGYRAQDVRLGAKCLRLLGYLPAHCHDFCGTCRCCPSSNSSFLLAPAALSAHSCLKDLVSAAQAARGDFQKVTETIVVLA